MHVLKIKDEMFILLVIYLFKSVYLICNLNSVIAP